MSGMRQISVTERPRARESVIAAARFLSSLPAGPSRAPELHERPEPAERDASGNRIYRQQT